MLESNFENENLPYLEQVVPVQQGKHAQILLLGSQVPCLQFTSTILNIAKKESVQEQFIKKD